MGDEKGAGGSEAPEVAKGDREVTRYRASRSGDEEPRAPERCCLGQGAPEIMSRPGRPGDNESPQRS